MRSQRPLAALAAAFGLVVSGCAAGGGEESESEPLPASEEATADESQVAAVDASPDEAWVCASLQQHVLETVNALTAALEDRTLAIAVEVAEQVDGDPGPVDPELLLEKGVAEESVDAVEAATAELTNDDFKVFDSACELLGMHRAAWGYRENGHEKAACEVWKRANREIASAWSGNTTGLNTIVGKTWLAATGYVKEGYGFCRAREIGARSVPEAPPSSAPPTTAASEDSEGDSEG